MSYNVVVFFPLGRLGGVYLKDRLFRFLFYSTLFFFIHMSLFVFTYFFSRICAMYTTIRVILIDAKFTPGFCGPPKFSCLSSPEGGFT